MCVSLVKKAMVFGDGTWYNSKRCAPWHMNEGKKELLNVDTIYLLPGEERCVDFRDANGVPKVHYTYCSIRGKLSTAPAAQRTKPSGCVKIGL